MPWFPDFVNAAELARIELRAAGRTDPVAQYIKALSDGTSRILETAWPGEVVVYDPRAGRIHGHRELRKFVVANSAWFAAHSARVEIVASTRVRGRAVVELLAHLRVDDGSQVTWPVAVVAESTDDLSIVFRTYCSQQPVDGRRHLRPPILEPGHERPADPVGRYHTALDEGDVDTVLGIFAVDGYYRESIGAHSVHRGGGDLRSFFTQCFSAGGGIELTPCVITDDGLRCAVEYNCLRWGTQRLPPQAGIGIYERDADGLLTAVRVYDDVEAPVAHR